MPGSVAYVEVVWGVRVQPLYIGRVVRRLGGSGDWGLSISSMVTVNSFSTAEL